MGFASERAGDKFGATSNLNFDQYEQDNTLQLIYEDDSGRRTVGLRVKDRPNESIQPALELVDKLARTNNATERAPLEAELQKLGERYGANTAVRFFAGKQADDSIVRLADKQGRPRLVLKVDGSGAASIEFLDESGTVVQRIPAPKSS